VSKGKNEDGESCSDEDSEDEENQTVSLTTLINSIYMIVLWKNNPENMAPLNSTVNSSCFIWWVGCIHTY